MPITDSVSATSLIARPSLGEVEELSEDVLVAQALAGSERDRVRLVARSCPRRGQPLEVNLGLLRPLLLISTSVWKNAP